jgi:hypothetical protein
MPLMDKYLPGAFLSDLFILTTKWRLTLLLSLGPADPGVVNGGLEG